MSAAEARPIPTEVAVMLINYVSQSIINFNKNDLILTASARAISKRKVVMKNITIAVLCTIQFKSLPVMCPTRRTKIAKVELLKNNSESVQQKKPFI